MVISENMKLEKTVVNGVSCIAVPIEAFVPVKGEPVICSYSFCIAKAEEWEKRYFGKLLSSESLCWLEKEFSAIAENIGYRRVLTENDTMLEYVLAPGMHLPKSCGEIKTHKISSNVVLGELCRASGCDIEIADDGEDIIFAVVDNGELLAYAGMNDVSYEDESVEISVETSPAHRRKGYGAACVKALSKHLADKGKTIRYKCADTNYASVALAERCGFVLEGTRFSFVCEKI
ncbi:MAG: GNAT family N-acetyltransferase [Clostridia bacterium]|nr:GNAT family N-acetyltransferase [Clostridia bacterium]